MNKKLGHNAIVFATLNYIKPTKHWHDLYPNNYGQKRFKFKVIRLEQNCAETITYQKWN